jgi:hypothetical protein
LRTQGRPSRIERDEDSANSDLEELSVQVAMNLPNAARALFQPNQIVCLSDRHLSDQPLSDQPLSAQPLSAQHRERSVADRQPAIPPTVVYGEVVQYVPDRHLCWVRPLAMAQIDPEAGDGLDWADLNWQDIGGPGWIFDDLREGSDLLLPAAFFEEALDTEVLPLMARLYQAEEKAPPAEVLQEALQVARQRLNQFVRQICQAYPELFGEGRR